jgi:hypothetical protein
VAYGPKKSRYLSRLGNRLVSAVRGVRLEIRVPHYGVVEPGRLIRSGQPDRAGYLWLRSQGVRTVVDLREASDDEDWLLALGFEKYLHVAIPREQPPSSEQVDQLLMAIGDPANWPVHVHCLFGASRTGIVIALVRMVFYGWSAEEALREASTYFPGPTSQQAQWLRHWEAEDPSRFRHYSQLYSHGFQGGSSAK